MNKPRKIILHAHIFKNAGTTFDFSLKRCFGEAFVDHREDDKMVNGKQTYLEEFLDQNPKVKALSSHSVHFIPTNNDKYEYYCVYLLRHPIERMRSVYDFEKRQNTENLGAKKAKELEFDQYVLWRMTDDVPATIRNCQTIFMSGKGPNADYLSEKFEIALANSKNSLVGITHRYDESMIYFESKLQKNFPRIDLSYVRKNITDENIERTLNRKIREVYKRIGNRKLKNLVKEKNKYDLKLFKKADRRLSKRFMKISNRKELLKDYEYRLTQLRKVPAKPKNPTRFSEVELLPSSFCDIPRASGLGKPPIELASKYKASKVSIFEAASAFGHMTGMKNVYIDQSGNSFGSDIEKSLKPSLTAKHFRGNTLSVVSRGATTIYYHWMVDLIPKLYLAKKHYSTWDFFDRIIVNRTNQLFQKETLELLGIPPMKVETNETVPVGNFERLITCDFKGTFRMDDVVKIWAALIPSTTLPEPTRRIYISREDSSKRNVINEDEVFTALEKKGFEKIVLTGLTLQEQVRLFQESKFIISPHGASLTNLLWCQPSTRIIELFSQHIMPGYFNLARARNLEYHYFRCNTEGSPANNHQGKNIASMILPKVEFLSFVQKLLACSA